MNISCMTGASNLALSVEMTDYPSETTGKHFGGAVVSPQLDLDGPKLFSGPANIGPATGLSAAKSIRAPHHRPPPMAVKMLWGWGRVAR